jgi:lipoprotein-anchoring transpeptidase ErfK/SrfK
MRWAMFAAPLALLSVLALIILAGVVLIFTSSRILPGIHVAGIAIGGMDEASASATIAQTWEQRGVLLTDGEQVFPAQADMLGITLNADESVRAALRYGHGEGGIGGVLRAAFTQVMLAPVIALDRAAFAQGLAELAPQINREARNAGVEFVNGGLQPREAVAGAAVDVGATLARFESEGARALRDGTLELIMQPVIPTMTDPMPILATAQALVGSPLELIAYNPVTDARTAWQVPPERWVSWLTAQQDSAQPIGMALSLHTTALAGYLAEQQSGLGSGQYLNIDESIRSINDAIAMLHTQAFLRIYNRDRQHVVGQGETLTSIAWDYGVPYPYIQAANPRPLEALAVGDIITIPSADTFLDLPVIPEKRIVVSISEQRVRVYENGALRWDWLASTGIASSPTWTGVYQIISHERSAYAGNWDLWMADFMGVYRPVPGADFTNGFHGFPTRGGSQLLWTNSLGTRVTYGCILLSNENIRQLYDWAEDGVVVEIRA